MASCCEFHSFGTKDLPRWDTLRKQTKKQQGDFCGGFHQRFWQIFVFDKLCVTHVFSVCDFYLASWTLAAAMAPFQIRRPEIQWVFLSKIKTHLVRVEGVTSQSFGEDLSNLDERHGRISPRNLETPRTIKISATLPGTKISHPSREVRKIIDSKRAVYGRGDMWSFPGG